MTYLITLPINKPGFLFYRNMIKIVPDMYIINTSMVVVYLELSK